MCVRTHTHHILLKQGYDSLLFHESSSISLACYIGKCHGASIQRNQNPNLLFMALTPLFWVLLKQKMSISNIQSHNKQYLNQRLAITLQEGWFTAAVQLSAPHPGLVTQSFPSQECLGQSEFERSVTR